MEAVTALLAAISTLAWPLIALAALLRYSTQISRLLDKFSQGKLTIKVGNTELTMEEVSKQQWQIVEDIQAKVAELEQRIGQTPRAVPAAAPTRTDWRILWVDDLPQNNRMLAGLLEAKGARIDLALSSVEALEKFKGGHYDVVISDMGRPEGKEAGIELARELRSIDAQVPYYIFCSRWSAEHLREQALQAGVNGITASGTTLLGHLMGVAGTGRA